MFELNSAWQRSLEEKCVCAREFQYSKRVQLHLLGNVKKTILLQRMLSRNSTFWYHFSFFTLNKHMINTAGDDINI